MKERKALKRIIHILNPIDTFKYYFRKMKQHKLLFLLSFILALVPLGYAMDLSALGKYVEGNFISKDLTSIIRVDLSSEAIGIYAEKIYNTLIPVGVSVATMYWLIGLGETSMRTDLSPEYIIKDFVCVYLTIILISNFGFNLADGFLDLGNGIYDSIEGLFKSSTATEVTSSANFKDVPWTKFIMTLLSVGGIAAFKLYIQIQLAMVLWARKVKLVIYVGLMPIGIADFRDGFHSNGAMYIKKIFALGLEGAVLIAISYMGVQLIDGVFATYFDKYNGGFSALVTFLTTIFPACLALLTLFKASEQFAGDVVGVHL